MYINYFQVSGYGLYPLLIPTAYTAYNSKFSSIFGVKCNNSLYEEFKSTRWTKFCVIVGSKYFFIHGKSIFCRYIFIVVEKEICHSETPAEI